MAAPAAVQKQLVAALRARNLSAAKRILRAAPEAARAPKAIFAVIHHNVWREGLELLLKQGADINVSSRGYRPLHALIQEHPHAEAGEKPGRHAALLAWMLKRGANPELLGAWPPARAILVAAFTGNRKYVDVLRKHGAKYDGFVAAAVGDVRGVEAALKKDNAFAAARDPGNLTALHCCCASRLGKRNDGVARNLLAIAKTLIAAGADVNAKTRSWNHDVDPIYFACNSGQTEVFELLLKNGVDATAALVPAAWQKHMRLAEIALAHGAEVNRAWDGDRPLLSNLIRWGQFAPALWLLEHGADPNRPDAQGWTAVHQAASRGNERILRALLGAGGDPQRKDKQGRTPLDITRGARRPKLTIYFRPAQQA